MTPPRRLSDVGPARNWTQESNSSPAFSPLQRLRQGPTFQPPRRSSLHTLRKAEANGRQDKEGDLMVERPEDSPQPALEQEIAGLQKALALESRQSREHFAVRRRLYQLQNAQAKQGHQSLHDVGEEAADELEKVKAALEELRRGGEEEKLHRSQLEERVMREIEDLKSLPASPMISTRSLSRQNLLAEERERKRGHNEQLHAEVQELQDALAELEVTSADEMEAQRLKEHQVLQETNEMKEQLSLAPAREEALQTELREANERLQSEVNEAQRLRRDVREQDEALASFWGLQSSYKNEVEEVARYRETTAHLQEEMLSMTKSDPSEFSESAERLQLRSELDEAREEAEGRRLEVETLRGRLPEGNSRLETEDLQAYQAVSSSLKELPQSFQDEIGLPASDSPVDSDDHQGATSQWCTSTIQKLASFTVSVLRENTQLREYTTTTGTTKAGTPRSQASADEAGGSGGVSTTDTRDLEVALRRRNAECARLTEAESHAEAKVRQLEKRLAHYENHEKSDKSTMNGSRPASGRLRTTRSSGSGTTSPQKKRPEVKANGATKTAQQVALPAAWLMEWKAEAKTEDPASPTSEGSGGVSTTDTRDLEAALRRRNAECARLTEAESHAEAKVRQLEKRLAHYENHEKSDKSTMNGSRPASGRLRTTRSSGSGATSPQKKRPEVKANGATKMAQQVALPAESLKGEAVDSSLGCMRSKVEFQAAACTTVTVAAVDPVAVHIHPAPTASALSHLTIAGWVCLPNSLSRRPRSLQRAGYFWGRSPQSAADLFAQAEALCESQHFAEAAELFRCVLAALRSSADREQMRSVEAEVWAHLGVAMQSLDDIAAAIESYCQAVRMDPSLHVCFANLATLYMYLEDFQKAEEHISKALDLEPQNSAYLEIKGSMRNRSRSKGPNSRRDHHSKVSA
eukprot:symbB.v1.2.005529.t3/scaffold323.1/size229223/6